ncbi:hypothetical protein QWY85_11545 [Neolewinella lacunae]|uniref:HEAT repeat domain-containing protein n=1 Tax=Neolewinella lacunae TaxID=1517758 RepID=A0A923PJP8_9BACT|nr:hypothetical protein [Neolewinella lacunae]MBC6993815.1 hypothetical protein [Neolewinella lacunae]MDN3635294.1 hypothetical protein [Neolewinella lacunae]
MNIRQQLLVAHSRSNADLVLNYVLADQRRLPQLLEVFLHEEYQIVQRAAMVVGDLGRVEPYWLQPYHGALLAAADTPGRDAVKRNVMRYFSEFPLEAVAEPDRGNLLDLAFRLLESPTEAVAIRVFAMQVVANFCPEFPELKDELAGIIELTLAEGTTPGFVSRGRKILQALRSVKES